MALWDMKIIVFVILFLSQIQGVQCLDVFYVFLGIIGGLAAIVILIIVIICVVAFCTASKRQVNVTSRRGAPVPRTGINGQAWAAPSTVGIQGSYGYYNGTVYTGQPPYSQIPLQNVTHQAQGYSQQPEGHPPPSYNIPTNQPHPTSPPPSYEHVATTTPSGDGSMEYNEQAALAAPNVVEPASVTDEK